jgi:hypothetical protein
MGVVSTNFVEGGEQSIGPWRYVWGEYTLHTGETRSIQRRVPMATSLAEFTAQIVPEIEAGLPDDEDFRLLSDFENLTGDDDAPDVMAVTPDHPDTDSEAIRVRRFRRKVLRLIYRSGDIKLVRKVLLPLYQWLRDTSGFTPAQIADYLGITLGQLSAVQTRMEAIEANVAFIDGDSPAGID